MRSRSLYVIANPRSAGGRGGRVLRHLRARLVDWPVPVTVHETTGPGDAEQWARRFPEDAAPGPILIVGGDGTLHEVANGLLTRSDDLAKHRPLALLPVGTGNDFNRMLKSGDEIDDVLSVLEAGSVRAFDVGRVRFDGRERYFVNLLGVGLDVAVLERRHRFAMLPGLMQYLGALITALLRFRPLPTSVVYTDPPGGEHHLEGRTLLTAVTVGPSVGGGFRISPDARPDDGALDLFQVERLSLFEILRILPRVMRGTQREGKKVHLRRLHTARISRSDDEPLTFELDGELMPVEAWSLDVDLIPGALMVMDTPCIGEPRDADPRGGDRNALRPRSDGIEVDEGTE